MEQHYKKVARFSQDDLLDLKDKNKPQVMVTIFNPRNPNISKIIRDNWNSIENTEELQKIFPTKPLIGFRRLPNLRDMITSKKLIIPPLKPLMKSAPFPQHVLD